MKVYKSIEKIVYQENSLLTIGTFDGIHLGHQKIISNLVQEAQEGKARSVLVTFYPHPQTVIQTQRSPIELLTPLEEKIVLLESLCLNVVVVLPFTQQLARLGPEDFVKDFLVQTIGIRELVLGSNHAFGQGRKGGVELLQKLGEQFGFTVHVVPTVEIDRAVVSSTRIRYLLLNGKVRQANRFLGRNYTLIGVVKKGKSLGRKLGIPTANIDVLGEKKLVPGDGVYAVVVHFNKKRLPGVTNIGHSPTIHGKDRGIEVHIHDFSGDLYGKKLKIEFIDRIRDEKQFHSLDGLISQIEVDREKSLEILSKN